MRFDLDKLRDPEVAHIFKATIEGRFAPLFILGEGEIGVNNLTTTLNTVVTEAATEILGKLRRKINLWSPVNCYTCATNKEP